MVDLIVTLKDQLSSSCSVRSSHVRWPHIAHDLRGLCTVAFTALLHSQGSSAGNLETILNEQAVPETTSVDMSMGR
jgi:hypothetical protein